MTKEEYWEALKKVNIAYSNAESEIKKLEIYSGEISMPAINELRYAGRHILRASENIDKSNEEAEKEILLASSHCTRALNDICDASIVFFLEEIRYFEEKYGVSLYAVVENYGQARKKVYEAQAYILNPRRKDNNDQHFYQESKDHTKGLQNIFERLNANKEMLEKERYKIDTKNMEDKKRFGITISISLAVIALSILVFTIKLFIS